MRRGAGDGGARGRAGRTIDGTMGEVELVEQTGPTADPSGATADDPAAPAHDPQAARRRAVRRLARRWWPVPTVAVLVVAALVGVRLVADHRADQQAERLRAVPGVLDEEVGPTFDRSTRFDTRALAVLSHAVVAVDGLIVGVTLDQDTPVLSAVDSTGAEAWSVPLTDVEDTPDAGVGGLAGCSAEQEPAEQVWCAWTPVTADPDLVPDGWLVRVDLATRSVVERRTLPAGASAVVADGASVVAEPVADGVLLTSTEAGTGRQRWQTLLPVDPSAGRSTGTVNLTSSDGHLLVTTATTASASATRWSVDPTDGRVEAQAADAELQIARDGRLVQQVGSSQTLLLGTDGSGTASAEGTVLSVSTDDGSVPDLLWLARLDGSTATQLRAVDAGSGEVVWEEPAEVASTSSLILLDGVLYGYGTAEVWARDAATGEQLWTAPAGTADAGTLLTDGRSLLHLDRDAAGDRVLVADDLRTGEQRWSTPLPDGVTSLFTTNDVLYGATDDGEAVLLR
ncbi:MAG TPA: hypothetical protein VGC67_13340 [Cellulomonas sp.]